MTDKLSHVDESGEAKMVDVSAKPETARIANRNQFVRRQKEHRKRAFRLAQNFRYRFAHW